MRRCSDAKEIIHTRIYVNVRGYFSNHIPVNIYVLTCKLDRASLIFMENRIAISLKLPPSLLKALDSYREKQTHKPTRTQVIEDAIKAAIGGADGERGEKAGRLAKGR